MAYSLTLPSRNKAHRIRMAIALDAEPDFSVAKLLAWCGTNMSKQEMLGLIDSLQKLSDVAEDDETEEERNGKPKDMRGEDRLLRGSVNMGMDRRPQGGHINTAKAESEFYARFPDARRLKTSL